jgi:G:T-mismatch repair DNA endonuclease (very short patch repair protein)
MMYKNEMIEIKINHANIKFYKDFFPNIEKGQIINISQENITPTTRTNVKCKCDFCNKDFYKRRVDVSNLTFCKRKCRNDYMKVPENNANFKDKITVNCEICDKSIDIVESKFNKQEYFLCSRDCYKIHRSQKYSGSNMYNYQDVKVNCIKCGKSFKTTKFDLESRENLFCSQECYYDFRKENYREVYWNTALIDRAIETKPERIIREALEEMNINFESQYELDRYYFIDFYLPEWNLAIEVNGDYWHGNPEKYDEHNLNDIQIKNIKRDRKKYGYFKKVKMNFLILWENDIYNNLDDCKNSIVDEITRIRNDYTPFSSA